MKGILMSDRKRSLLAAAVESSGGYVLYVENRFLPLQTIVQEKEKMGHLAVAQNVKIEGRLPECQKGI